MQLERRSESDRRRSEATKGNQRQEGLAAARVIKAIRGKEDWRFTMRGTYWP
jgi:hypothetical protein